MTRPFDRQLAINLIKSNSSGKCIKIDLVEKKEQPTKHVHETAIHHKIFACDKHQEIHCNECYTSTDEL